MYYYKTMPFGLRNVGATYQHCKNHVFGDHIGSTVKAYVDDIVVKTRNTDNFACLRAKSVRLNPEKCVFEVPQGMLLGFIVSERGIEANPEVSAITGMGPIKDVKGVQRVMGCLAALSRFISRLGEKGLPLYCLLRKTERFIWTPEAEEALGNLKKLLSITPILVPPSKGEPLLLYVAATIQVVSAAMIVKRKEEGHTLQVHRPIYFFNEVLFETKKICYPQVQKLLYAVVLARRKLHHYFDSHPMTVVSSFPLGEIIQSREASRRVAKWAIKLMGETLSFAPKKAIKPQILAGFLAEWTDTQLPMTLIQAELWTMYFDGSLIKTGAGAGLLSISPLGVHLRITIELRVRCLDV
jgi:hypothetical protein